MIQRKKKICKRCQKEMCIYAKGLCSRCYTYIRKREQLSKTRESPSKERSPIRRSNVPQKRKRLSDELKSRRESFGYVYDANSQPELFNMVWQEAMQKGKIRCPVSGREITSFAPGRNKYWMHCCAHVLPKGMYPALKLCKENIMLLHPDTHRMVDNWLEQYRKEYPNYQWDIYFSKRQELKKKFHLK